MADDKKIYICNGCKKLLSLREILSVAWAANWRPQYSCSCGAVTKFKAKNMMPVILIIFWMPMRVLLVRLQCGGIIHFLGIAAIFLYHTYNFKRIPNDNKVKSDKEN